MEVINLSLQPADDSTNEEINAFLAKAKTDFFSYSGQIHQGQIDGILAEIAKRRFGENVIFHLATFGGDADAAYRLTRYLKKHYATFTLSVTGYCKSAGSLIALGATDIAMGQRGEFGPLDVQIFDPDEFMQRSSGLAISQAIENIGRHAFDRFEEIFLNMRQRSSGLITTKTASEIATAITVGLFSPITEKMDASRIGEMQRSMDIAQKYGQRLGADKDLVHALACGYPSHSFVIDYDEAAELFANVREHSDQEKVLLRSLRSLLVKEFRADLTRLPEEDGVFCSLTLKPAPKPKKSKLKKPKKHANPKPEKDPQPADDPRRSSRSQKPEQSANGGAELHPARGN